MIKILIVDDEKPICDLIDLNLSAAGYFCKSVQDGMKAIECIEREKFDLILLDIMLPGVDGFDIMEYIRPLKIPVIFITARGDVKDRHQGNTLESSKDIIQLGRIRLQKLPSCGYIIEYIIDGEVTSHRTGAWLLLLET